jgi:HD-like signal output (HDOD) protein
MSEALKHIMFVDDEPDVLSGLQRVLMDKSDLWEMVFVNSGEQALKMLSEQHFDVIVSDMRMPGIDGASLLSQVHERHPDVVRIILTGHAGLDATLRAMPVAHHFLTKPCQPSTLEDTVRRACDLQQLLNGEALHKLAGSVDKLPVQPKVYNELTQALQDPKTDLARISRIITKDLGLCSKILHLTNSSFFGLPRKFSNAAQAISFIGTRMIREVVLSAEVFGAFEKKDLGGLSLEREQRHAMGCAAVARIVAPKALGEAAFLTGMLHDIGKLVWAMRAPKTMRRMIDQTTLGASLLPEAERSLSGLDHGAIGAYLLGLWNLSNDVVEAVAYHHEPRLAEPQGLGLPTIVHIANGNVHELECEEEHQEKKGETTGGTPALDLEHIEAVGALPQLDTWRKLARELWSKEAQDGS